MMLCMHFAILMVVLYAVTLHIDVFSFSDPVEDNNVSVSCSITSRTTPTGMS